METLNAEDGESSLISGEELEEYESDDEGEGEEEKNKKPPFLYCMNLVRTKHNAEWTRGARVKSLAICSKHQYMHVFKPA